MPSHLVLYRKALAKRLNAARSLQPAEIALIVRTIATRLPPA
ncbi:MAG TPA: hypothetical protein VIJ33_03030 [Solirubrobacteraceae bacterium]